MKYIYIKLLLVSHISLITSTLITIIVDLIGLTIYYFCLKVFLFNRKDYFYRLLFSNNRRRLVST